MPLNKPNPAAGRPTGPFPAVPPYIDQNGIPTNDPGSEDAPITAPITAGDGAGAEAAPAAPAGPTPFNSKKILEDNKLDPTQWTISGEPIVKPDKYGAPPTTPRSQNDYTVVASGPNGQVRTLTLRASGAGVDDPKTGVGDLTWTTTGVDQTVGPPSAGTQVSPGTAEAEAAARIKASEATAAKAAADLKTAQDTDANRQKNLGSRGLLVTDDELSTIDATGKSQNLTQQQIDQAKQTASDNNQRARDSNLIAAQNANTNAQVAASNDRIAAARLDLDKAGLTEQQVRDAETHVNNVATLELAKQKQANDELVTAKQNIIAEGQLANSQQANTLRGQEATETQRHNVAQETATTEAAKATAAAQAATNATTAAGDIMKQGTTNAATGAGLLQQRMQTAGTALNGIMGSALGSNIMSVPKGVGANLVGGLTQWATDLGGGDATMEAAARMVQAADPKVSGNPALASQLQQTYATILQHYQEINGTPAPPVAAIQAAKASGQNGGTNVTAPVTAGGGAATNTGGATAGAQTTQQVAPGGGAVAPTAPTSPMKPDDYADILARQKVDAQLQAIQAKAMPPTPAAGTQGANGVGVPNPYATFISPMTLANV